jgi:ankyrin repeat protein
VETHSFDINILLNEKSALFELLSTAGYLDFNILNYLMKKRRPCVNSGVKLPLNQAILRGNPFIIKTLIEYGKPNPYVSDINGKSPLHIAAAKLDMQTIEMLVAKGADPIMPDKVGNTMLHILAFGTIRDVEYDFIKQIILKYNLRLTRN